MLKLIRNFINGLAIGLALIIPGISVGTIILIMGFYFELIETVNHFFKDLRKSFTLMIPLLIGVAAGALFFSSIVDFLIISYSFPTMLFFIGMAAGIVPPVYSKAREEGSLRPRDILLIVVPFVLVIATSLLREAAAPGHVEAAELIQMIDLPYMIFLLFAGIITASALVIPGFSGAFVLLLFGVYHLAIYSISSLTDLLRDPSNLDLMILLGRVIIPLGIGTVIGGLSMARIIETLLKKHPRQVYLVILGLILGSVCALFRDPIVYASGVSGGVIALGLVTFALGGGLSFFLGKKRL